MRNLKSKIFYRRGAETQRKTEAKMIAKKPTKPFQNLDPITNGISGEVIDAAYKVHFALGPGLLEFNDVLIKDGITRIAHGLEDGEPLIDPAD